MSQDFKMLRPELGVGATLAGFVIEQAETLPEIGGCAYVLRHTATRARVMWLANADDNKAFAIAFKTPPANSTGVFHILEHSVLCGSDRYPVKEPFVHLLKSSMQTFLNALTFSDKTMYPVASTNDRDLENLMDIYLDAVLHPAIYTRPRIFEQEGWHLEPAATEQAEDGGQVEGAAKVEGTTADATSASAGASASNASEASNPTPALIYNGVVYNEMKGAFSNPDELLINGVAESLFAGGPYGWVSGGDPACIPGLSYEEFLNTHARHYQLANSYTVLYGNLDIAEKLAFLDKRFCAAENRGAGEPNPLPLHEPVMPALRSIPMATTPDNACCAAAYVFATASERERVLAADILMDALVGSNEAPLKRAILESVLGRDVTGFVYDGLLQPMLIFELKGSKPNVADEFRALVERECARLVAEGLGTDNLEASLAQAEFNLREGDWGYPDGVGLAIQAMSGWLYDDGAAVSYLRYEDELAHMHEGLSSGYFERLLDEAVCQSKHACAVEVVPTQDEGPSEETQRLAELAASMDETQLASIAAEAEALHAEQAAPDTPEALATLPHLTLADIGEGPAEPKTHEVEAPVPCYLHEIETHGIDYVYAYFDLGCLSFDELPYASVLAGLLGKLGTEQHSALELDTLSEGKLGNLSFFCEVYSEDGNPRSASPKFVMGASALAANVGWAATLPAEMWQGTRFDDKKRVRDILEQRRIGMEMAFVESGHAAALARVGSYSLASSVVTEQLGGVDFYRFLRELLANFDERADELAAKLDELCARIFRRDNCELGFTGTSEDLARFWEAAAETGTFTDAAADASSRRDMERVTPDAAPDATPKGVAATAGEATASTPAAPVRKLEIPAPIKRNEAFIVPSNVCYVGEGMAGRERGTKLNGAWRVAAQALSFDYLWNEVRVLGGAYGCGFRCTAEALLEFYSYRDPAIDPTVRRFEAAAAWLAAWQPSQEELEGFLIACVGGMDAPVKPRAQGRRLDARRLAGRDPNWHERLRAEVLAVTLDELHALASPLAALPEERGICVFGGREQIEATGLSLDTCELFSAGE